MEDYQKLQKLLKKSRTVFQDSLLPNGCLIAAPAHMPYYPTNALSYLYAWPGRDLGFNTTAALDLNIDVFDSVLKWIWQRAEGYRSGIHGNPPGLIYQDYHPNGRIHFGALQPDQTGTLLWAIATYAKKHTLSPLMVKMVKLSSDALIAIWHTNHFRTPIEDLWEERIAHHRFKTNITYTLAAVVGGLESCFAITKNKRALKTAEQMKRLILQNAYDKTRGYFLRRFGPTINDTNLDASMLGLVWPFNIVSPKHTKMRHTLTAIEKILTDELGVYRYQFDDYEGELESGHIFYKQKAGAWPLLTFWLAIVLHKASQKTKAKKYFWQTIKLVDRSLFIPEQFFPKKDKRIGVKPLLWSHMMMVHAAKELGYL